MDPGSDQVAPPDARRIRPWLVEFADPRLETEFRRHGLERHAATLRRSMFVAAAAVLVVTALRLVATGLTTVSVGLSLLSAVLSVVGVAFGIRVGHDRDLSLRFGLITALSAWGMLMAVLGPIATGAPAAACHLVVCGLLFGEFLFLPNRLVLTTVVDAAGVAAYLVLSWTVFPAGHGVDAQSTVVMVVLVVVAAMTAATLERTRREEFLSFSHEQRTIARLSEEIATRHEVEAELSWLADHDTLTDLLTRRAFFEQGDELLSVARRSHHPAAVLVIDADHFKSVNDRYGHHTGDEVIRRIARACRTSVRAADVVGRLGGEEFAIVLAGADESLAVQLADDIRRRIGETKVDHPYGPFRCTVSVGVAECEPWHEELQDALQRADAAMYDAKQRGRNRTAVAPQRSIPEPGANPVPNRSHSGPSSGVGTTQAATYPTSCTTHVLPSGSAKSMNVW